MISLAQRVRDFRYSKGWGPDELASRAEISRTALYQIESGKTGLPRAGTLRRIAVALDVSMDDLLGHVDAPSHTQSNGNGDHAPAGSRIRDFAKWMPEEGGPLAFAATHAHASTLGHFSGHGESRNEESRLGADPQRRPVNGFDMLLVREGEIMSKLHELLHSPLGAGVARIVDDLHQLVVKAKSLS
jgi:transcriptional regulator with XRE-family HTH domain